jgi:hypothetical protein
MDISSVIEKLFRLPETHHPALGIGEKGESTHARHVLLLDADAAARFDDLAAVGGEITGLPIALSPIRSPG